MRPLTQNLVYRNTTSGIGYKKKLKKFYFLSLLPIKQLQYEKATLENHILFQTYYDTEEEKKVTAFKKKLAASSIRLKAAQTVNSTYKKIIEVLLQDAIYYDVIIRSLVDDIKDQENYVNYILDVGKPAFALFRVLSLNYVVSNRFDFSTPFF